MKSQLTVCQKVAWVPDPINNPVGRSPVKEGKNLPGSETEDVGDFSLCPTYSGKELRRIERLRIRKAERSGIKNAILILKFGGRLQW